MAKEFAVSYALGPRANIITGKLSGWRREELLKRVNTRASFELLIAGMLILAFDIQLIGSQIHSGASNTQTSEIASLYLESIGTISTEGKPSCIAVNEETNLVYIGTSEGDVVIVNGTTKQIITKIQFPRAAGTLEFMGEIIVDPQHNRIFILTLNGTDVIDGATNRLVGRLQDVHSSALNGFHDVCGLNPITNRFYAGNSAYVPGYADTVEVYDTERFCWLSSIDLPETASCPYVAQISVAVNPATNRIYAIRSIGPTIYLIDGTNNTVLRTANCSVEASNFAAFNPFNNYVYLNYGEIIDGVTLAEVDVISPGHTIMSFDPVNHILYAVGNTNNTVGAPEEIRILDGYTHEILASTTFRDYTACAVNAKTGEIYASQESSNKVLMFQGPCPSKPILVWNLSVSPKEVEIGETVAISFRVRNLGDTAQLYDAVLKTNDSEVMHTEIPLTGRQTKTIAFSTVKNVTGEYTVSINGVTGVFTVHPGQPDIATLLKLMGLILLAIISIVIFACVLRKAKIRKKPGSASVRTE